MADDSKTEKATPKRRRDERKKGNVFVSKDVIAVASLLIVFFAMKNLFPGMYRSMTGFLYRFMDYAATTTDVTDSFITEISVSFIVTFVQVAAPIILLSMLVGITATLIQTKLMFSTDSLKPKFSKLNPLEGFKKLLSLKSLVEVIKNIIKLTVLIIIIFNFISGRFISFGRTIELGIINSSTYLFESIIQMVFVICIAFAGISALDYFYQWWDYERQIKMSKHDIKEEFKQMEGDPQIKGKIRQLQRDRAMSRMMQAVPEADVVIKNPTHFAVALKYNLESDGAPILIAKGQDELALRIIKVAEENNVSVVENKPLARSIFSTTELNQEIPAEHYGEIAEILVYVYKLNNKQIN